MEAKRILKFWLIGLPMGLYTTFVLQTLWNWFVAASFNVPEIPFWGMYGFTLLIGVLFDRSAQEHTEQLRWKGAMTMFDACVPEHKRETLGEALKEQEEGAWTDLGGLIFGRAFGLTTTLGLGWIIHMLAY